MTTKIIQVLILVAMITVMLSMGTAQACACGVPDWSTMSDEQIVSTINAAEDEPRIMYGQIGQLPPAPIGYEYSADYRLVLL
jgi:hypothetical protein